MAKAAILTAYEKASRYDDTPTLVWRLAKNDSEILKAEDVIFDCQDNMDLRIKLEAMHPTSPGFTYIRDSRRDGRLLSSPATTVLFYIVDSPEPSRDMTREQMLDCAKANQPNKIEMKLDHNAHTTFRALRTEVQKSTPHNASVYAKNYNSGTFIFDGFILYVDSLRYDPTRAKSYIVKRASGTRNVNRRPYIDDLSSMFRVIRGRYLSHPGIDGIAMLKDDNKGTGCTEAYGRITRLATACESLGVEYRNKAWYKILTSIYKHIPFMKKEKFEGIERYRGKAEYDSKMTAKFVKFILNEWKVKKAKEKK